MVTISPRLRSVGIRSNSPNNILFFIVILTLFSSNGWISNIQGAVIGIDLGMDTYKAVLIKPGFMDIVLNESSGRKTFNGMAFTSEGRLFAEPAFQLVTKRPSKVYYGLHSLLGKRETSVDAPWIQHLHDRLHLFWIDQLSLFRDFHSSSALMDASYFDPMPFGIRLDQVSYQNTQINGKDQEGIKSVGEEQPLPSLMLLQGLFAQILTRASSYTSRDAGVQVRDVVLTVPNYWTTSQRHALIDAAHLAYFNVLSLLNQQSALALKYMMDRDIASKECVIFYDLGASDLQVSLYQFEKVSKSSKNSKKEQVMPKATLLAQSWDQDLGGIDFDNRMSKLLLAALKPALFQAYTKRNLPVPDVDHLPPVSLAKIYKESKRAKEILSANKEVLIFIEGLLPDFDFKTLIKREAFENQSQDLFQRALFPVYKVLEMANMKMDEIQSFEVFGGGTRIPKLQETLISELKLDMLSHHLNSDEAAAFGASFYAASLSSQHKVKLMDFKELSRTPYTICVKTTSTTGLPLSTWTNFESVDSPIVQIQQLIYRKSYHQALELIKISLDNPDMNRKDEIILHQGIAHFFLSDDIESKSASKHAFQYLTQHYPDQWMGWHNLAVVLQTLAESSEALEILQRLVSQHPSLIKPRCNQSLVLASMSKHEEALEVVEKALSIDPKSIIALNTKALIYQKMNQYDMALSLVDLALSIDPSSMDTKKNRCLILLDKQGVDPKLSDSNIENNIAFDCIEILSNNDFSLQSQSGLYLEIGNLDISSMGDTNNMNSKLGESVNHQILELFHANSNLGIKRQLTLHTNQNMLINLYYPKNISLVGNDSLYNHLYTYQINWPTNAFDDLHVTSPPAVKIRFELNTSGLVNILSANATIPIKVNKLVKPVGKDQGSSDPVHDQNQEKVNKDEEIQVDPKNSAGQELNEDSSSSSPPNPENPTSIDSSSHPDTSKSNNDGQFEQVDSQKTIALQIVPIFTHALDESHFDQIRLYLKQLNDHEKIVHDTEKAKNELEALIYRVFELLEDASFILHSTPSEREEVSETAARLLAWFEEGNAEKSTQYQLITHHEELDHLIQRVKLRVSETTLWSPAVSRAFEKIQCARKDVKKIQVLYTLPEDDLKKFHKEADELEAFVKESNEKQANRLPHETPLITSQDLQSRANSLSRESKYLLKKKKLKVIEVEKGKEKNAEKELEILMNESKNEHQEKVEAEKKPDQEDQEKMETIEQEKQLDSKDGESSDEQSKSESNSEKDEL